MDASKCTDVKNYKWRLNPVCHHRVLYSCTHVATVSVKGLTKCQHYIKLTNGGGLANFMRYGEVIEIRHLHRVTLLGGCWFKWCDMCLRVASYFTRKHLAVTDDMTPTSSSRWRSPAARRKCPIAAPLLGQSGAIGGSGAPGRVNSWSEVCAAAVAAAGNDAIVTRRCTPRHASPLKYQQNRRYSSATASVSN